MHAATSATVRGEPAVVQRVLSDLGTWPHWQEVISRSEPSPPGDDGLAAWQARLGMRVGPVDLGVDLRMVRAVDEACHLRFERREEDGRQHSAVVIDVRLTPDGEEVAMDLDLTVAKQIPFVDLQRELDRRRGKAMAALQELVDRGA